MIVYAAAGAIAVAIPRGPGLVFGKIPSRSSPCLCRCLFMTEAVPSGPRHVAVMPAEVLHWLAPSPGQVLVDATAGAGGHSLLLARAVAPAGRVIALDRDPAMLDLARKRLEGLPATFVEASFDQLRQVLDGLKIEAVDGVLADLGI